MSHDRPGDGLDHSDTHTGTTAIDDDDALATAAGDASLRAFADGGGC